MSNPVSFWWDFRHHPDGSMTVIVECSDRKADGRILAEFQTYHQADQLICDLKSGRVSYHTLLKKGLT